MYQMARRKKSQEEVSEARRAAVNKRWARTRDGGTGKLAGLQSDSETPQERAPEDAVAGSNPVPATNNQTPLSERLLAMRERS